jgi:hypothetical protein
MTPAIFADIEDHIFGAMALAARGPQRNGFFALWLIVRACQGLLPPEALTERIHLQRLRQLERRLSSLSLPAPLRRAIASGIRELQAPTPDTPQLVLQRLVGPAADSVGPAAAAALAAAARTAAREVEARP